MEGEGTAEESEKGASVVPAPLRVALHVGVVEERTPRCHSHIRVVLVHTSTHDTQTLSSNDKRKIHPRKIL